MQLSLRSQMIAGVAAVGATAMAITPIAQPDLLPSMQRVSSAVQLASFANPVEVLLRTSVYISDNIFDQAALLDPEELYWPDSFYTTDFSFLFAPGYFGIIPDFANQVSFGGLSAVVTNLSGYVYAASEGLAGLVGGPITAVTNVPFALVTAAGYLAAGRPDLAIAELQAQILGPLQQGFGTALAAAGYIIDNVISNASTLILNSIPGLVSNLIDTVTNGAVYVGQSLITTLSTAITQLTAGQFDAAWNTTVEGLLGLNGTLGQLVDLTIGIGILEFNDQDQVLEVIVPSLRSDLTTMGQRLGDLSQYGEGGIRNDAFSLPVTVTPPAAATPVAAALAQPVAGESSAPAAPSEATAPVAVTSATATAAGDTATAASDTATAAGDTATATAGTAVRGGASESAAPSKGKAVRGSARGAATAN